MTICRTRGRVRGRSLVRAVVLSGMFWGMAGGMSLAEDLPAFTPEDIRRLAEEIEQQRKKLAAQEQALAEQQRVLAEQQDQLNALRAQMGLPQPPSLAPVAYNLGRAAVPSAPPVPPVMRAQNEPASGAVGAAPEEERPEISIIPEQGGVLTRRGQLVLEPQIEYAHSSTNRFFFQGFEVVDTVLIGLIEATDADRETLQAALAARLGITNRLELEARIPYLYRDDRVENVLVSITDQPTITESTSSHGLGDIEIAAHYQINDGMGGWPYFVGNLRVKTDTGEGPFDVDVDEFGIAQELATGSGFWGIQPSITAIFPSDPAVFFANLGYTWNIKRDIDKTIAGVEIGEVDPGDSINTTFGMGISLNERTSFSFGFEYDYVLKTTQERNGVEVESEELKIGSLLLGWSYQLSDNVGLNLNTGFGVTEDATDFRTTLRVPIRFNLF